MIVGCCSRGCQGRESSVPIAAGYRTGDRQNGVIESGRPVTGAPGVGTSTLVDRIAEGTVDPVYGSGEDHEADALKAVLDHVGIAVADLAEALAFYRDALGLEVDATEEVASQRVRASFVGVGDASLEFLEATSDDSPIARFVGRRGPGLHHITLRVENLADALEQLKARGVRLIDQVPRPGAESALVAFVHPSSAHGVLVELKQPGDE
jgi:methylmalonyl-CoA epimerase